MAYPAKAVANYFLKIADSKGELLDNLKLQKLIYFAHGWHLSITNKALVEEGIDAWKYGPVVENVYHEFRRFGAGKITEYALTIDNSGAELVLASIDNLVEDKQLTETKGILDQVWEKYGKYSGVELSGISHEPGTPWETVYKQSNRSQKINDDEIKKYFNKLRDANEH